jgi:hypothetical protein
MKFSPAAPRKALVPNTREQEKKWGRKHNSNYHNSGYQGQKTQQQLS